MIIELHVWEQALPPIFNFSPEKAANRRIGQGLEGHTHRHFRSQVLDTWRDVIQQKKIQIRY